MNKRFSTLLAAVLVAGGLSASAKPIAPITFDDVKTGDYVLLKSKIAGSTPYYLSVDDDGTLRPLTVNDHDPSTLEDYNKLLWTVTKTKKTSQAGSYETYQFVDKTGRVLGIDLKTAPTTKAPVGKPSLSEDAAKVGGSNVEWMFDEAMGLYISSGDSLYFLNQSESRLVAIANKDFEKTYNPTNLSSQMMINEVGSAKIDLTVADFNTILSTKTPGKLFFNNGKDVSSTEKNLLRDGKWEAGVAMDKTAATEKAFFLMNGEKTAIGKNPKMLMVDTLYYDNSSTYLSLIIDTLNADPGKTNDADLKATLVKNAKDEVIGSTRPIYPAQWSATYYVENDSIVLSAQGKSVKKPVSTVSAFYTYDLGTGPKEYNNLDSYTAVITAFNTAANGEAAVVTALTALLDAIKDWDDTESVSEDFTSEIGAVKAAAGYANLTGTKKDAFEALKSKITYTPEVIIPAEKYFFNGLSPIIAMQYSAGEGKIALRKLSNTYVLTVAEVAILSTDDTKGYIMPLVQPYASRTNGGSANIDVTKVYYMKDLKKADRYNPTKANAGNGFFFDASGVSETNYLAEGQAFNPYSQWVVEKTPGTDKGNYKIYNRTSGEAVYTGLVNQLSGDSIELGGDSVMLVDSKIKYTGKDAEKQIGHKFASAYDMTNKAFMISSASPFMKNMFLHMQKDSTLKVAEGQVLYKLEPVVGTYKEAYGAKVAGIDTLVRNAYYIKSAKGEYLVGDANGNYILSKDAAKNGKIVTLKGDKKVSVVHTAFFFIACNENDNFVVVPAAVQPNTVEAAKAETLTNACLDIEMGEEYKMLVNAQTGRIQMASDARAKNDFFFVATEEDPASLFTKPKHASLKIANGDMIGVGKNNFAVAARVGDLKATYEITDFSLFIDTARYVGNDGKDLVTPSYYITKGDTSVARKRLYMWVANDSIKANPDTYLYDTNKTRVQFRAAVRYGVDSLIVANAAKNDTVSLADGKGAVKDSKIYGTINNFRFNILVDKDNAGSYVVKVNEGNQYLQSVNGMIVATTVKADAARITVNNAPAPVGNEEIASSSIRVVAGEGNVTVYGAVGKKVFVSDVLGKTTTVVATSDSQVIPAAQGVAFISVEGEAAVKTVVK